MYNESERCLQLNKHLEIVMDVPCFKWIYDKNTKHTYVYIDLLESLNFGCFKWPYKKVVNIEVTMNPSGEICVKLGQLGLFRLISST